MKKNSDILSRLTILNSILIFTMIIVGILGVLSYRGYILVKIKSFMEKESDNSRFLKGLSKNSGDSVIQLPEYRLKINPKNLRKIEVKNKEVLKKGKWLKDRQISLLENKDKLWVPARFFHESREYKVKVRVRGDISTHWDGPKKSWRIKFKKNDLFNGYRELDVIMPNDKKYENEQVAYKIGKSAGLLVPNSHFALLSLNGIDMGLYFVIEKNGKEMLEKLGYPEGEFFRENNVWVQTRLSGHGLPSKYQTANYINSINRDNSNPHRALYLSRWHEFVSLVKEVDLELFHRNIDLYIDIEKYLQWNAITWIFGSQHSHWGDNLRWYYDNTTGLLEPILYDLSRFPIGFTKYMGTFETEEHDLLCKKILQNPEFRQRRNEILWGLVTESSFPVMNTLEQVYRKIEPHASRGVGADPRHVVEDMHKNTLQTVSGNLDYIKGHLAFSRIFITPLVYFEQNSTVLEIELTPHSLAKLNLSNLKINFASKVQKIKDVAIELHDLDNHKSPVKFRLANESDTSLTLKMDDVNIWSPVDSVLYPYEKIWKLKITLPALSRNTGNGKGMVKEINLLAINSVSKEPLESTHYFTYPVVHTSRGSYNTAILKPVKEFIRESGLPFRLNGAELTLSGGAYTVSTTLIIPKGYSLHLKKGTTLRLMPGVSILTYNSLQISGTALEPVNILPHSNKPWGSVAVVRAGSMSRVEHLNIKGGSETVLNGIVLSGQLCFYSSDVEIKSSSIMGGMADDGLNLKKSKFIITDTRFTENSSDAFDGDWCTGTVENSYFGNNGGDGIDISGSKIVAINNVLTHIKDKALSIGENSDFTGYNNSISHSSKGLAIKDLSRAELYACTFYQNDTAITLYRKKQIFGGGSGLIVSSLFWNNTHNFSLDPLSKLELNGAGLEAEVNLKNFKALNSRTGKIAEYYQVRGDHVIHMAGKSSSPFSTGPTLSPEKTPAGLKLPDLSKHPIGTIHATN